MPGDRFFPPGKFWQLCGTECWEGGTLRFPTYHVLEGSETLPPLWRKRSSPKCCYQMKGRLGLPVWKLFCISEFLVAKPTIESQSISRQESAKGSASVLLFQVMPMPVR